MSTLMSQAKNPTHRKKAGGDDNAQTYLVEDASSQKPWFADGEDSLDTIAEITRTPALFWKKKRPAHIWLSLWGTP